MDDIPKSRDEAFRKTVLRPLREAFSTLAERHDPESVRRLLTLFEAPPRPIERAAEWLELNISAEVAGAFANHVNNAYISAKEFHAASSDADMTRFRPGAPQLWPVRQVTADMLDVVDFLDWLEMLVTPPELSGRESLVVKALHDLQAVDPASRQATESIVHQICRYEDANSYKKVFVRLADKGMIRAKLGRGGGVWLTPDGASCAARLFRAK